SPPPPSRHSSPRRSLPTRRSSDLPSSPAAGSLRRRGELQRALGDLGTGHRQLVDHHRLPRAALVAGTVHGEGGRPLVRALQREQDRKSTRLNSSHVSISYAVFCLN